MKSGKFLGLAAALVLLNFILPAALPAQTAGAPQSAPDIKSGSVYLDFDDIQIPREMKLDKKKSLVYGSGPSKAGILIFSGRVEASSLASFFQDNMQNTGWRMLSIFKYRDYLICFLKGDRVCVITILDNFWFTIVEVRIGPGVQVQTQGK